MLSRGVAFSSSPVIWLRLGEVEAKIYPYKATIFPCPRREGELGKIEELKE